VQRLSQAGQTESLHLKRSSVWRMIRSRLCYGLELESWLAQNTVSGTPWQPKTMEKWGCYGYIGHLPSGSSYRLALLHNPTFCPSHQLWHFTLTNMKSDI
jgi:hypothetical protein